MYVNWRANWIWTQIMVWQAKQVSIVLQDEKSGDVTSLALLCDSCMRTISDPSSLDTKIAKPKRLKAFFLFFTFRKVKPLFTSWPDFGRTYKPLLAPPRANSVHCRLLSLRVALVCYILGACQPPPPPLPTAASSVSLFVNAFLAFASLGERMCAKANRCFHERRLLLLLLIERKLGGQEATSISLRRYLRSRRQIRSREGGRSTYFMGVSAARGGGGDGGMGRGGNIEVLWRKT